MYKFFCLLLTGLVLSTIISYQIKADELQEQLECMAEAIYFEARSESLMAQIAVGIVIKNRVESDKFPDDYCSVVHQGVKRKGNMVKHQCAFSYYCDGKSEKIYNDRAYFEAMDAAMLVMLEGATIKKIREATHYHAIYVKPSWARKLTYLGTVGLHKFYK